jgi:class 3 adenylate cyclase/DNA polymerase III delta prime subunit
MDCPSCGAENPPGKKFCGDCGAALMIGASGARAEAVSPAPPTPSAERRQLTVMFCDLVGSTALASKLDPEDLREVIGAYHRCVDDTVRRFGGFVAKYMGDGVLVYFGYPQAHEDDAEQAVRSGLILIAGMKQLDADERLRVRIGIATGLVIVGDLIGTGAAQEQAVVGETPNLAARLQTVAAPDSVVIAASTRRLIGGLFECDDLGAVDAKGFAEPVRAWRVRSESAIDSRYQALRSGETALVGRDEEIELLRRRWRRVTNGGGEVVLLSGEPGIGKSRLTAALLEEISGEPHTRLLYFCSPHHTDSALHPVIRQLERAVGFARDEDPSIRLAKLDALLSRVTTSLEDARLIADLLSLPDGRFPRLDLTPQQRKQRTLEALLRQLEYLARRQPVLLIFEDVHWIDPTSLELMDRTVDRIRGWPVLLLMTFRPEFRPPWTEHAHVTIAALSGLDPRDGAAIVERIAGNRVLPTEIVNEIVERTDGVPLFVEELTKAVLEASDGNAGDVVTSAPGRALAVPSTLHASLMARLDRLRPAAKEVAQIGAAIGREFSYELLFAVAQWSETKLRAALGQLVGAGLAFCHGLPPAASYLFKHALVQDAAYGTLLRVRRQELHGRIATTLEDRFPETVDQQPELLARHCTQAGWNEKAIAYWGRAGRQSLSRSAMIESVAQVRKGLDLLAHLSDGPERWRRELDLQRVLGAALLASKGNGVPETGQAYARAREMCERLGDTTALIPVLGALSTYHQTVGEYGNVSDFRGHAASWRAGRRRCWFFGRQPLDGALPLSSRRVRRGSGVL